MTNKSDLVFSAFQVAPAGELYEQEFLAALASVESHSHHWMASKIVEVAKINNMPIHPVIGFREFEGEGVGGAVEVKPGVYRAMVIGTRPFIAQCGLQIPETLEVAARQWEKEGAVISLGGWDAWVRGIIKFAPEAVPSRA